MKVLPILIAISVAAAILRSTWGRNGEKQAKRFQIPSTPRALNAPKKTVDQTGGNPRYYTGPLFAKPGAIGPVFAYGSFAPGHKLSAPFAIIDLETSALSPKSGRIIEVAVMKVSSDGQVIEEFSTLINPGDNNVGKSEIHGIYLDDIMEAPNFEEIKGNLLAALAGCIVIAHHAKFEEGFLTSEFQRVGLVLPALPTIDTLWLAQELYDLRDYKLHTVLNHLGQGIDNAHTALGDVRAIGKVLNIMLGSAKPISYPAPMSSLPSFTKSSKLVPR